jgi:hypothetical protein
MASFAAEHILTVFLLIGMVLAFAAVAYLLLKLAQKLGGEKAVWAVGIVLVGLIAFEMFDVVRTCNAAPVFSLSQCDASGRCESEMATFACDGPGGAMDYGLAYLICPAAAAFVGFLSFVITRRSTKGRVNA